MLLGRDTILARCHELARAIAAEYTAQPPCIVAVLEGARTFTEQLTKLLPGRPRYHEVRASSYGAGTVSSGKVVVTGSAPPVAGQRVLLVEDIVDTGRTIDKLRAWLLELGAVDVRVATLLSKPSRRVVTVPLDYVGFEIPDEFVIGYGMDYAGKYRELPDVVIYQPQHAEAGGEGSAG